MDYICLINIFIDNSFNLIKTFIFTPLLLIGLLITSLSLILTLKNNNIYIKEFKNHKNSELFVKRIFKLSGFLIFSFFYSLIMSYIYTPKTYEEISVGMIVYTIFSIIYLYLLYQIAINLFMITFNIKSIVLTSLKD